MTEGRSPAKMVERRAFAHTMPSVLSYLKAFLVSSIDSRGCTMDIYIYGGNAR